MLASLCAVPNIPWSASFQRLVKEEARVSQQRGCGADIGISRLYAGSRFLGWCVWIGNRQVRLDGTIALFATRWEAESFLAMEEVES